VALGSDGEETYGVPDPPAKAMTAELSIALGEAVLHADDCVAETIKDFKSGTLPLGVDDIGIEAARDLAGAMADDKGVLISASEKSGAPAAGHHTFAGGEISCAFHPDAGNLKSLTSWMNMDARKIENRAAWQ
jgi:hypothetical protein